MTGRASPRVIRRGARVYIRHPAPEDCAPFVALVRASRRLHRPWAYPPQDEAAFRAYLARVAGDRQRGFLICRVEDRAIVGQANVSEIVRGGFQSAFLGVNGFAPYQGMGYATEGVCLVLDHVFLDLGLHRIEANIQPGNERSVALVRRLGFRKEGFSERYLKIGGRWRDHERWALLKEWWRP